MEHYNNYQVQEKPKHEKPKHTHEEQEKSRRNTQKSTRSTVIGSPVVARLHITKPSIILPVARLRITEASTIDDHQ